MKLRQFCDHKFLIGMKSDIPDIEAWPGKFKKWLEDRGKENAGIREGDREEDELENMH